MVFLIVLGLLLMAEMPNVQYKIKFENDIELQKISEDPPLWRLEKELLVWVNDTLVIVPKDFTTDLASIPYVLQWKYNPLDRSLIRPAVLHDYFYKHPEYYSRRDADEIFYYSLQKEGNSFWDRYSMYIAVRLMGWRFYAT